jgi:hypothetical protein
VLLMPALPLRREESYDANVGWDGKHVRLSSGPASAVCHGGPRERAKPLPWCTVLGSVHLLWSRPGWQAASNAAALSDHILHHGEKPRRMEVVPMHAWSQRPKLGD